VDLQWWAWAAFGALVATLLLVDYLVAGRGSAVISFRRAVVWSIVWTVLGFGFGLFLWAWQGSTAMEEYMAGFLIEKSLSIDNLFVFALIFAYFAVPAASQRRVLFWGIAGAIVLRGVFIAGGAVLLDTFHYTIYVFGAILIVTGIRMARHQSVEIHPERNPALKLLGRVIPLTTEYRGDRLTIREAGKRVGTPLLAALVLVATFDVVFAVDSIPAIFAVTREPFVVYAANAFSLLGLAALYFVLANMLGRFRYLNVGLAVVLVFVGVKMTISDFYKIPIALSLGVILLTLALAVVASLLRPLPEESAAPLPEESVAPASEETPAPA
jgi:tellurite resistance protein TerC